MIGGTIILQLIKNNGSLLELIYKDLAQPGVQKVGLALETVLNISNTLLSPIKTLNEKNSINFKRNMEKYRTELESLTEDLICEVPPEIGVPILEKLIYIRSEDISELYINLLAKASSYQTVGQAHPSFVQIISNLSVDEALIIKDFKEKQITQFPCLSFKAKSLVGEGFRYFAKSLTGIEKRIKLLFPQNIKFYLDNLSAQGIIIYQSGAYLNKQVYYEGLVDMYLDLKKEINDSNKDNFTAIDIERGLYEITDYGVEFINTCFLRFNK